MMNKEIEKLMLVIVLFSLVLTTGPLTIAQGTAQHQGTQDATHTSMTPIAPAPKNAGGKTDGLICSWSFDEGSGDVAHDSVGGNDGLVNDCNWVTGHSGTALQFLNPDSYVYNIPGTFDDSVGNFFSIQAWVFWYGTGTYNFNTIFDGRVGAGLFYITFQHKLAFYLDPDPSHVVYSDRDMPELQWTLVQVDFNDAEDSITLYINGVVAGTGTTTYSYGDSQGACIGNSIYAPGGGESAPFNGIIDEVKIFNGATANQPPYAPSSPKPANNAMNVSLDSILSWTGGDPDGDPVTYAVYFGTTSPPAKIASNQSTTSYALSPLSFDHQYYWQIVARDNHSATNASPIWTFTTQSTHRLLLFGTISDKTQNASIISFKARSMWCYDKVTSILKKYTAGEEFVITTQNKAGFVGNRFIIGKFDGSLLAALN
jgi:hypothetical protein